MVHNIAHLTSPTYTNIPTQYKNRGLKQHPLHFICVSAFLNLFIVTLRSPLLHPLTRRNKINLCRLFTKDPHQAFYFPGQLHNQHTLWQSSFLPTLHFLLSMSSVITTAFVRMASSQRDRQHEQKTTPATRKTSKAKYMET